MKGIVGIAHAAYMVSDMKVSLKFYAEQLGFKHVFSIPRADGTPWIEYLQVCEGQFVELFYPEHEIKSNSSYLHLCLRVKNCEETCADLEAKGVKIDVYPNRGADNNVQMWIHDPDNNPIEIMEIAPNSPHDLADKAYVAE